MRRPSWWLLIALTLFGGVVILPGEYSAWFAGPPLGVAGRVVIAAVFGTGAFIAVFRPVAPVRAISLLLLSACVLAKIWIGAQSRPEGWRGVYEMTDTEPPKVATFFWRFGAHTYRIDPVLGFPEGRFPLHFLNDLRFNDLPANPREVAVPLRITWTGFVNLRERSELTLFTVAYGRVSVTIDSAPTLVPTRGESRTESVLSAGLHQIVVVYEKPVGEAPALWCDISSNRGPERVFPDIASALAPANRFGGFNDTIVVFAGLVLAIQLFWCYAPGRGGSRLTPRHGHRWAGVAAVVATEILIALALSNPRATISQTPTLTAGNDPLGYESNARNIMEQGWLMPLGAEVGRGQPYFFYPLYPYVLAGAHWVIGDDVGAAALLNRFCLSVIPLLLWLLGWSRLKAGIAIVAQAAAVTFILRYYWIYSELPYTDCLFVVGVLTSLWLSFRLLSTATLGTALATGMAAAATTATKPTLLLFPFALAVGCVLVGKASLRTQPKLLVILALGWILGVLPFTLRNYVMSGRPVLLATLAHAFPYALLPPEYPDPWSPTGPLGGTHATNLQDSVRLSWRIFVTNPGETIFVETRKVLFTFGLTNLGPPGVGLVRAFPLLSVLFGAVIWRRCLPLHQTVAIVAFAASLLLAVVAAYPWTYGYKTILPLHLVFLWTVPFLFARQQERRPYEVLSSLDLLRIPHPWRKRETYSLCWERRRRLGEGKISAQSKRDDP